MMSKKEMYQQRYNREDWPGYAAIQQQEKTIYPDQEPIHWAPIVPYELGGEDPLWASECFKSQVQAPHFHYISLGFTNLWYNEEWAEAEESGFGFELTFRHIPIADDPEKPMWPVNMFQNIARYVFESRNVFADFNFMSANGPLRAETETAITAMLFYTDPQLKEIDTPHGHMAFIQIFGITTQEYQDLKDGKYKAKDLLEKHIRVNPLLITNLERTE